MLHALKSMNAGWKGFNMEKLTGQNEDYIMKPVAFVRCQSYYRYEAPRQAEYSTIPAVIEFRKGQNFETALADLKGFERIWVLFVFHLNCRWSPKVRPPLSPDGAKYGVFATRSPHRPNRIGMSCVKLLNVDGLRLTIANSDMLDGTPVLDVKPYIPEADSFPDSAAGWRDHLKDQEWTCAFVEKPFLEKALFLREEASHDLESFARIQLRYHPLDSSRKRISQMGPQIYALGFRTWQVIFSVNQAERSYVLKDIASHYKKEDLLEGSPDPYLDKDLHRKFLATFPGTLICSSNPDAGIITAVQEETQAEKQEQNP